MSRISNWAFKRLLVGFLSIGNKYLREGGHIGREFSQDDIFGDSSQRVGKVNCASGLQVDRYIKMLFYLSLLSDVFILVNGYFDQLF